MHREGDAARAGPPLEFGRAADASHKFDPGVGPRVADAEDWREHTVLEERDVEAGDRVGPVDRGGREPERPPGAVHKHEHFTADCRRAGRGWFYPADAPQPLQKLLRREAVQILDNPVVRQDSQLIVREHDRQKPAIFLAPRGPRVLACRGGRGPGAAGRAVVAVGDVEEVEVAKRGDIGRGVGHLPADMPDAIGGHEVKERLAGRVGGDPGGERARAGDEPSAIAEAEKHGLGMAGGGQEVPGAVVFLVGPRLLVLADLV